MRERDDYTGRLFEREAVGECLVIWDGKSFLDFPKSVEEVKRNSPWEDPSSPDHSGARILHRRVAHALGVEEWTELEIYTAVGSPLDRFHGVDCFLVWRGRMVTIDVTRNPNKDEDGASADLLFRPEDSTNEGIRLFADRAATILRERHEFGVAHGI